MKSAVSEKDYESRSWVQGGDYQGTGVPGKYGTLRESFMDAVPHRSKERNTSPGEIGYSKEDGFIRSKQKKSSPKKIG